MFSILWAAQLGSTIGVWMQVVGAQWFLVESAHSPALVAWVQTATLIPVLFLALPSGALADSRNRRTILLVSTFASMIFAGALTALAITDELTSTSLLAMLFLLGGANAFMLPAWQAIQPELVPRKELPAASSLNGVIVNLSRAVGPALAGVLVAASGPALVFGINAASFVFVIVALLMWKRPPQKSLGRERMIPALGAGVRYTRFGRIVRRILLRAALFTIPGSALWALLPSVAADRLGLGSSGYGLLLAALGVGALLAVTVQPKIRARHSENRILAAGAIVFAVATVAAATLPVGALMVLLLAGGFAWLSSLAMLNALMQLSLAQWVRGRALSIYSLVFMGTQGVGAFVWGLLANWTSIETALMIASGLLVLTAVSVYWWGLLPNTGKLDFSMVTMELADPDSVYEPEQASSPLHVAVQYFVPEENDAAFVEAMNGLERARRRTGAYEWHLNRRAGSEKQCTYVEEFSIGSWEDYKSQVTARWTAADSGVYQRALDLIEGDPLVRHYYRVV
ncbi:MAG: MFS transporter [Thermoleophilaceae bacterium]|nr:MFS transporter [Thermoleophilaceae bacterium]